MNDFLQSLRNGQAEKQRTPKTRKNFDNNSYHYTSPQRFHSYGGYQNSRNQNMKRPPSQQQPGNQLPMDEGLTSMLAEAIENLNNHIETLVKNQDYLINAQEKTADMVERQAIAIERIVDHLNIAPAPEADVKIEEKSNPQKTFEHHYVTSQKQESEMEKPVESFEKPLPRVKAKASFKTKTQEKPTTQVKPKAPVKAKAPVKTKTPVKIKAPVKAKAPEKKVVTKAKPVKSITRKRKKIVEEKSDQPISTSKENKLLSRDTIMDIIDTMRSEGSTFDQVASRLVELGQPTFSGRGEWHAQTIHRLCNKK